MFDSQISALIWALPLVLGIGAGIAFLLKRLLPAQMQNHASSKGALTLRGEPLVLSPHTTLYCVEIHGNVFLITESERNVTLASGAAVSPTVARNAWGPWKSK